MLSLRSVVLSLLGLCLLYFVIYFIFYQSCNKSRDILEYFLIFALHTRILTLLGLVITKNDEVGCLI